MIYFKDFIMHLVEGKKGQKAINWFLFIAIEFYCKL